MSTFTLNSITVNGLSVISRLIAGSTLEFTRIAVGDGALPSDKTPLTVTDLSNRLFDVDINNVSSDGTGSATVSGVFSNADRDKGFFYRELGLYAKDPSTGKEILYCYGNAATDAEWISPSGASSVIEKEIKITTLVGNAEKVTANIKSGIYETKEEVARIASLKADLDATKANGGRVLAEQMRFDAEQVLYVNASAAAGGNGSAAKPFKTIMAAVAAYYPGARNIIINVAPGSYPENVIINNTPSIWNILRNGSGTVNINNMTLTNVAAVLKNVTLTGSSTKKGLNISNCSNISLENITINGASGVTALYFSNTSASLKNITISNCETAIYATNNSRISINGIAGTANATGYYAVDSVVAASSNSMAASSLIDATGNGIVFVCSGTNINQQNYALCGDAKFKVLPIAGGGTGATTVAQALKNLGIEDLNAFNPTGTIIAYAGKDIPDGYLLCDGSQVSRTTYSKLFSKGGTLYGTGDGSTTFTLPNLIDRFVEGGNSSTAGSYIEAGLPDAIGFIDCRSYVTNGGTTIRGGGVFSETQYVRGDALIAGTSIPSNVEQAQNELQFSLSRYNGIYGTASTVQPAALHCQYLIKY